MEIKRTNPKALETIALRLKELAKVQGKVGWFESSKYEDGTPVAYVAAIQELGYSGGKTFTIPPRPFMRPTAIKERQKWAALAGQIAKEALNGKATALEMMELLTTQAEGDVAKAINTLISPPLSPVTIELRAMKERDPNLKVTRGTVFQAIRNINKPGYVTPNVSDKPLEAPGKMLAELTHIVEPAT